jgi:hypothetical protein
MSSLTEFVLGFGFNLLVAVIVVRWIYYPGTRNQDYAFTFLAFNTIIYFVLSFMSSVELSVGVGFGLFAIFSVLRYRTDPIPIREMTYLFIIAALPVMNSTALGGQGWTQLLIANAVILLTLLVLEKGWGFRFIETKRVTYERIDLISPEKRHLLLEDLRQRTGLDIERVVIGKINFLRDTADIQIEYRLSKNGRFVAPSTPEEIGSGDETTFFPH